MKKPTFDRADCVWLQMEIANRLSYYKRRVQDHESVLEAADFARWLRSLCVSQVASACGPS